MLLPRALCVATALYATNPQHIGTISPLFINAAVGQTLPVENLEISAQILTALRRLQFEKAAELSQGIVDDTTRPLPLIAAIVAITNSVKDGNQDEIIRILNRDFPEPKTRIEFFLERALVIMKDQFPENGDHSRILQIWHGAVVQAAWGVPATLAMMGENVNDDAPHTTMTDIAYIYNALITGTEYPYFRLIDMMPTEEPASP